MKFLNRTKVELKKRWVSMPEKKLPDEKKSEPMILDKKEFLPQGTLVSVDKEHTISYKISFCFSCVMLIAIFYYVVSGTFVDHVRLATLMPFAAAAAAFFVGNLTGDLYATVDRKEGFTKGTVAATGGLAAWALTMIFYSWNFGCGCS
jgi:hypothetical protein